MIFYVLKMPLFILQITWQLICDLFTPLTVILHKRLKIENLVRQKMGAEHRQSNSYEQQRQVRDFNKETEEQEEM